MALDSILARIQDETAAQARAIVQEARQQAEKSVAASFRPPKARRIRRKDSTAGGGNAEKSGLH